METGSSKALKRTALLAVVLTFAGAGLPAQAALFAGPAAFTAGPATSCANNGFGHTLQLTDTPTGFTVTGTLLVNVLPNTIGCGVTWTVERPIDPTAPNGQWTLGASIGGTVDVFANGLVLDFSNVTRHTAEGALASAYTDNGGAGWGPGLGQAFAAGPVNTLVDHQWFGADALQQAVHIVLRPDFANGGAFVFDFPVSSQTAPTPAPPAVALLLGGLCGWVATRRRTARPADAA